MNKDALSIATVSWARNREEIAVLKSSLAALAALHIPVFITDGGSPADLLNGLKNHSHFTVASAKGLWPQAKSSIEQAAAAGAKWILYTEPDKEDFFSTHLSRMIEETSVNEKTGVVLASRSADGLSSFPPFQQMTETTINNCCREVIGKKLDYCYGPFLFNAKLNSHLALLPENCGWGWRPFAFAMAHRLGFSVEAFEAGLKCPPGQQRDDEKERRYRMKQLTQNIEGLLLATSVQLE